MRRLQSAIVGTLVLTFLACGREPAPALFQPTLEAATNVARQRYNGDLIVFVSDGSSVCRHAEEQVFRTAPLAPYIATHFAAVEVPAGSNRPQILITSDRLNHFRLHIVRLDRINPASLLRQLQTIKESKTIDDYRSRAGRTQRSRRADSSF